MDTRDVIAELPIHALSPAEKRIIAGAALMRWAGTDWYEIHEANKDFDRPTEWLQGYEEYVDTLEDNLLDIITTFIREVGQMKGIEEASDENYQG